MAKKITSEVSVVQLSPSDFKKENIEVKVTQNDIIDALVEEQVETFTKNIEELQETYYKIMNEIGLRKKENYEEIKKIIKSDFPKNVEITILNLQKFQEERLTIFKIDSNKTKSDVNLYEKRKINYDNILAIQSVRLSLKITIDNMDFFHEVYNKPVTFIPKKSKTLAKAIEDYNKKVDQLFGDKDKLSVNERDIARKIKNKFTKELLKSASKDFKEQLALGFGFNIE